jgi:hypothetical protein
MKIETSYFIKTINDVLVWLAVGAEIPSGAIIVEERPVIMPAEGMALKHKTTGTISTGHWLREGSAEDWEEIEEPKEQGAE